jgi:hypothetical protein
MLPVNAADLRIFSCHLGILNHQQVLGIIGFRRLGEVVWSGDERLNQILAVYGTNYALL